MASPAHTSSIVSDATNRGIFPINRVRYGRREDVVFPIWNSIPAFGAPHRILCRERVSLKEVVDIPGMSQSEVRIYAAEF